MASQTTKLNDVTVQNQMAIQQRDAATAQIDTDSLRHELHVFQETVDFQ